MSLGGPQHLKNIRSSQYPGKVPTSALHRRSSVTLGVEPVTLQRQPRVHDDDHSAKSVYGKSSRIVMIF
ncbi:hypothetical protein TNCV_4403281 [Trichonephila clavipes]|uniref:Uncharacterized protein n=1 Tax=Trichonephila clavipes TaxID=2585209 RepID=A0A8X6SBY4_TRICX|nr:hypothetical protein TNCV_4403281 [Trichonephila clavipes]